MSVTSLRCSPNHRSGAVFCIITAVLFPTTAILRGETGPTVGIERHVVVSVERHASEIGEAIMNDGGNAVDAAVATAFALAVTHPAAGNIGGGGFMMIHPGADRDCVCIEYRETAPAAATATMFTLDESRLTHRMVGVPGTVRGLSLAHERYGTKPWAELVEPAVRLAADGFAVSEHLAASLNFFLAAEDTPEVFREYFGNHQTERDDLSWEAGETLIQAELARTLERIRDQGAEGFYGGTTARQVAEEMKRGGGLITTEDLANYVAKIRHPIRGMYRGYMIYGPPPPSSGGIALVEALNLLEGFNLRQYDRFDAQAVHLITEATRRAFRDRAAYLGDPDHTPIPVHLTSKTYAHDLADTIDPATATPSDTLAGAIPLAAEGTDTTHFSVIDSNGMAVSNTYTLEQPYGSRVVVRGAGFLLNNEMGDFNRKPGYTDRMGHIGTRANLIAPGKRMLSSQTPVIGTRDGQVRFITGSPGGRTIINTVLCVVLNLIEFELPPREAVDSPRHHHGWFPDMIRFERAADPEYGDLVEALRGRGHTVFEESYVQGDAHTIWYDDSTGNYVGLADPRRGGAAAGN